MRLRTSRPKGQMSIQWLILLFAVLATAEVPAATNKASIEVDRAVQATLFSNAGPTSRGISHKVVADLNDGKIMAALAAGPTTLNQNGSDDTVDVLADCGARGAGSSCKNSSTTPYVVNSANCHDDYAAITACIANHPGRTILFPHTCSTQNCIDYYSSRQIVVPHLSSSVLGTYLVGASRASGPNAQLVRIKFPSGVGGVFLYSYHGIENLWLEGSDTFDRANLSTFILPMGFGGTGPAVDGLVIGGRAQVRNMVVSGFARHCITADSGQTGGSDKVRIDHIMVHNCRGDGLNMNGTDSQVGTITNISADGNQLYGVRANSAYGNTWIEVDTQRNHSPYRVASTRLAGTISRIVCNGSTCVVTMTSSNTMYVDDYVTLAGTSDAKLNTSFYVTAVGANTFTFAATQNETLGAGGTATYNNGLRVWSSAGSVARGGGYNVPYGVLIDPYSEGNEPKQWDTFTNGSSAAIVIRPQGNLTVIPAKNWGPTLGAFYVAPTLNGLIDSPSGSRTTVRLNNNTVGQGTGYDYNGPAPIVVTNSNPTATGTQNGPIQNVYSSLLLRRTFYGSGNNAGGNASNWWCWMLPGSYNASLSTSDHCMADQLTDPLRSAIKGHGLSWFPGGMLLGTSGNYTPSMFIGAGTAPPITGTWRKGDTYINVNPSVGGVWAWQCTTAGTPGTWTPLRFGGPTPSAAQGNARITGDPQDTPPGAANISGPSSSTNNDIACFNGATGTALRECITPISGAAVATAIGNVGFVTRLASSVVNSPLANTDYYFSGSVPGQGSNTAGTADRLAAVQIPRNCTATKIVYYVAVTGTLDTAANPVTFHLTTGGSGGSVGSDYSDSRATATLNTYASSVASSAMSDALTAGTNLLVHFRTPAGWTTQPTNIYLGADLYCR
ncbi:MAG: hypothetical protein ACLP3R_13725 [Candidatus Korobacteraceae bacterium]